MSEYDDAREARWNAVYGASVAVQAFEQLNSGRGAPESKDFDAFYEEAVTVADMAEEAWERRVKAKRK